MCIPEALLRGSRLCEHPFLPACVLKVFDRLGEEETETIAMS
jgi:hypothetical protein